MTAARARNLPASSKRKGFAIVMALSLLSIVFLLVISLVNLVGTDLSLADSRKEKVLAQAHARMGMMVAIGEIQKHLGPDTRVSATADILDERIESGRKFESEYYSEIITNSLPQAVSENQAIDLNENGSIDTVPFGQRYWTGVWKHRARRKGASDDYKAGPPLPKNYESGKLMDTDPMHDSEYDPHPAIEVSWLVSGNEGWTRKLGLFRDSVLQEFVEIPDGIRQGAGERQFVVRRGSADQIYGNHPNAWQDYETTIASFEGADRPFEHPLFALDDPDDEFSDTVWILRRPLLEEPISDEDEESGQWRNKLHGEPVKVLKTHILADDPEKDRLNSYGSYAYWVGDEGVKTKININSSEYREISARLRKMDDISISSQPNINFPGEQGKIAPPYESGEDGSGLAGLGLNFASSTERSKTLSLSMVTEEDVLAGDPAVNSKKIAAHYHSATTDSYGVLADVRTGGLKRDLSHAFANLLDWYSFPQTASADWMTDFLGFIYNDRVHYFKEIPMRQDSKANEWDDNADSEPINDYSGVLNGPFWRTLGSFHNLYLKLSSGDSINSSPPEQLPRYTGDNFVSFDNAYGFPNSGKNPFWENAGVHPLLAINSKINYFKDTRLKPGPKTHPIQPILLEFKYAQTPTVDGLNLALAMYPSVALWNPYDVAINMSGLYIEVPLSRASLFSVNPKEYDRWRKWCMWVRHKKQQPGGGGSYPGNPPGLPGPVGLPGNSGPFGFLGSSILNHGTHNNLILFPRFGFNRFFNNSFMHNSTTLGEDKLDYPQHHGFTARNSSVSYAVDPDHRKYRNKFHFLWSNAPTSVPKPPNAPLPVVNDKKERHLLLKIGSFSLEPGEKANFVVSGGKSTVTDLPTKPNNLVRQYFQIELVKSSEELVENGFICRTDLELDLSEPLCISNIIGKKIYGIHPTQGAYYNAMTGELFNSNKLLPQNPEPKGITMYSAPPHNGQPVFGANNLFLALDVVDRKPFFKVTKDFTLNKDNIGGDDWIGYYKNAVTSLKENFEGTATGFLPGNGFRLRFELPGNSDSVVFEQYNIRSLVHSSQDGFGDNWKVEHFNSSRFAGFSNNVFRNFTGPVPEHYAHTNSPYHLTYQVVIEDPEDPEDGTQIFHPENFADFYKHANNGIYDGNKTILGPSSPPSPADLLIVNDNPYQHLRGDNPQLERIVPAISSAKKSRSVGFFHDDIDQHSPYMDVEDRAVMFELPRAPMLSILQLRHANLNDYSHSPSYILGNSYAPPQVGRYKTWGRVKSIAWAPDSKVAAYDLVNNFTVSEIWDQDWPGSTSPWRRFISDRNINPTQVVAVRRSDSQNDHQNTTVDHSFYANRTLLDGFMMSGVAHGTYFEKSITIKNLTQMQKEWKDLEPGESYRPFRNPRLIPYLRDNDLSETSYGDLKDDVESSDDRLYRYQTLAADIILNGAFNINSTSVDAWVSQLSALRNKEIINRGKSAKTPVPRFLQYLENAKHTDIDKEDEYYWDKVRILSDEEISLLAHCLVEQIKLRGPFLSFSDFVNRRIVGTPVNLVKYPIDEWRNYTQEDRSSVLGLRGAMQAAVAEARINGNQPSSLDNPDIPLIPLKRFTGGPGDYFLYPKDMNFLSTKFGLTAYSMQAYQSPPYQNHEIYQKPGEDVSMITIDNDLSFGTKIIDNYMMYWKDGEWTENFRTSQGIKAFKAGFKEFEGSASLGEAPDNLLAVENLSTAANKPDWVMQSDILSPLAPVTSARSDTFVIRVMGENQKTDVGRNQGRAWIELTVQRTPDYVKRGIDAPHHRPHEPFEDRNFNGYWDDDPSLNEHWLDLNQNGTNQEGTGVEGAESTRPDLPGTGNFPDGLFSDLPLNADPEEEPSTTTISTMGINQRFGRKFKIVKFRWIKDQDV